MAKKEKAKKAGNCAGELAIEKPKPTVYLSEKEIPSIKDWKIGEKYTLEMNVEMVSISKDNYNDKNTLEARFQIVDVMEADKTTASDKKASSAYKVEETKEGEAE